MLKAAKFGVLLLIVAHLSIETPASDLSQPSLDLLEERDGKLGWAGIAPGMSRAQVQKLLHKKLPIRKAEYVDVCGEYFSEISLAARKVQFQWSSSAPSGQLDQLLVPVTGTELHTSSNVLARRLRTRIPALVDGIAREYGGPPRDDATYLVLQSNPDFSVLIKAEEPEQAVYLTKGECVD